MSHVAFPVITLLVAAALGLLDLWLGVRLSLLRRRNRVSVGDGGQPAVEARMRAHANFTEYVPIALILMMLIELCAGGSTRLWLLGAVLVIARLLHPFGMDRPAPNAPRAAGAILTWAVLLALVIWAATLAARMPLAR